MELWRGARRVLHNEFAILGTSCSQHVDLGRFELVSWQFFAGAAQVDFWQEFRVACERARPDSVLIGELIHGDYTTHVGEGKLHACTNYQTSKAIWSSLNDANYFELTHSVQREWDMYGSKGLVGLLNFLGNHDTTRVCTRLTQPMAHYPLAAAFLLTSGGVPCLYYGDEGIREVIVRSRPRQRPCLKKRRKIETRHTGGDWLCTERPAGVHI